MYPGFTSSDDMGVGYRRSRRHSENGPPLSPSAAAREEYHRDLEIPVIPKSVLPLITIEDELPLPDPPNAGRSRTPRSRSKSPSRREHSRERLLTEEESMHLRPPCFSFLNLPNRPVLHATLFGF